MTKSKIKNNLKKEIPPKINSEKKQKFVIGIIFIVLATALLLSFISYFFTGNADQSQLTDTFSREVKTENWLGNFGAYISHFFLYSGFGVTSFLFVRLIFLVGVYLIINISLLKLRQTLFWDLFIIVIGSILLGFFWEKLPQLGGTVGYETNLFLQHYIGKIGTILLLVVGVIVFLVFKVKISVESIRTWLKNQRKEENKETLSELETNTNLENDNIDNDLKDINADEPTIKNNDFILTEDEEELGNFELKTKTPSFEIDKELLKPTISKASEPNFEIKKPDFSKQLAAQLVKDFGEFNPTLDLSNYQMPSIELLKDYNSGGITINQTELEENKNRIVDTLKNYSIGISQIKATVGPTVTLYEIVPDAGIRISKIKNLEDDIALSLSALGIRIIAPIPGKGTIGIEVPNNNPTMVSMKSVIASPKFQTAEMELPVALGKTISNETFVVDLAKMPHLLMAGATGQGKSVGLNAGLTSLLYKKHPAEVKFVLVDPKKVELTLFNKIERHYLAKLPDTDEAIITDNAKVINTLNSLCIEMDNRYSLLKDAMVRNIKEYNEKFKQRKLNPENGHRYLPYIVLVVDEFADLIMTAGKEVETPIARLAQLARAIGIHLIIATQRPSVNVITGIIKANFPARIAFRVTSKIDSRTILDNQGADQLIGRGDMLYTQGNDLVRVQCAFVDTPEVAKICDFIGAQKAYPDAYLLPEYVGEESGTTLDIDISERDSLFREAAEVIVTAQQGSASLIQRKLKLGYNRAGRIIDQLEAAGIVGPFEGSKARAVLIPDLVALEHFFKNEENSM